MKLMRLAACAVAFAVVGGMAVAEDMDIKSLQAKLAAQEARLNDLQAKMGSGSAATPSSIVSLKKNAKVTIGGTIDTRYIYDNYTTKDSHTGATTAKVDRGDFHVDTADLRLQIDVNENFDAFMRLGSHEGNKSTGVMRDAWIRWKNIACTGWNVVLGRSDLVFGMGKPAGIFDAWIQDSGTRSGMSAEHINYGASRTTQINPYWVSQDGKFRFDFSLIQSIEARNAANSVYTATDRRSDEYRTTNYGLGSGTMKLTWKPTEDLTIVGAMAHLYSNAKNGEIYYKRNQNAALAAPGSSYAYVDEDANPVAVAWDRNGTARWDDRVNSSSNTALHLGFTYNPAAFCKKLTVWGQGTYEMNTAFIDDQDYLGINAGVKYDFTDKFSAFVMGDFMRGDAGTDTVRGWRGQIGGIYTVGNGLWVESGWSHESITTKHAAGDAHAKAKGDTLYTRVVFDF